MKANELMIGDWMQDITPCVIDAVGNEDICTYRNVDGYITANPSNLKPIPLTTEILERNGFIKDEDKGKEFGQTYHILIPTGYEAHSFTVQVTIYKEPIQGVDVLFKCWGWIPPFNGGLDDIHLCSLKYVHQMQHALRLCGLTELADNFKV